MHGDLAATWQPPGSHLAATWQPPGMCTCWKGKERQAIFLFVGFGKVYLQEKKVGLSFEQRARPRLRPEI